MIGAIESRHPRVSVCIPTVDRIDLLREAIGSVAGQTWRDFEIVIADNSGIPSIQERIDGVMAEFPDLRFVLKRHPHRIDVISNFNSLIDTARGELWVCLTDDDRVRPNFLARSIEALDQHPQCALTFADHWIIRGDGTLDEAASDQSSKVFGRSSLREGVYPHGQLFEIALKQAMCLQTAVFRRQTIELLRFLPGLLAGDQSLFLRLSASKELFDAYYIDERIFEYRVHASQISRATDRKALIKTQIAAWESVADVPLAQRRSFKAKLSRCYLSLALLEVGEGDTASARIHARHGLGLSFSARNVFLCGLVASPPRAVRGLRWCQEMLRTMTKRA
jgi:glycosyltransferase involved in cell wall biosynthesis